MAEPTKKSQPFEELITAFTGKDRPSTIRANKCTTCDNDATTFSDELSREEYSISGMCQQCQDSIFGED